MAGEKVHFTKEKETLLITLYGKALESRRPGSLLNDHYANEAIGKIDYDFSRLKVDDNLGVGLAIRARRLDDWVRDFLAQNPGAVVLHLGCGLDTRIFRINPPTDVKWFDIDYPEVVALREKLYPARENYRLVPSSVTEQDWLAQIPAGPAMIVAEGLTPYLHAEDGERLFSALVAHFDRGELILDAYSNLGLKLVRLSPSLRATGAELHWAINDPHDLERSVPGLHLIEETTAYEPKHAAHMSSAAKAIIFLWRFIPPLRRIGRLLRYRF